MALRNRKSDWLGQYIDILRTAFRDTQTERPFAIDAVVILPEHLHTIWTLPPGDADYPGRWKAIKSGFTHGLARQGIALQMRAEGSALVWQRRYWEHTIRDESDWVRHVDTIHFNPVKHRRVDWVIDWPHSSFHRYLRLGWVSATSGGDPTLELAVGEPAP